MVLDLKQFGALGISVEQCHVLQSEERLAARATTGSDGPEGCDHPVADISQTCGRGSVRKNGAMGDCAAECQIVELQIAQIREPTVTQAFASARYLWLEDPPSSPSSSPSITLEIAAKDVQPLADCGEPEEGDEGGDAVGGHAVPIEEGEAEKQYDKQGRALSAAALPPEPKQVVDSGTMTNPLWAEEYEVTDRGTQTDNTASEKELSDLTHEVYFLRGYDYSHYATIPLVLDTADCRLMLEACLLPGLFHPAWFTPAAVYPPSKASCCWPVTVMANRRRAFVIKKRYGLQVLSGDKVTDYLVKILATPHAQRLESREQLGLVIMVTYLRHWCFCIFRGLPSFAAPAAPAATPAPAAPAAGGAEDPQDPSVILEVDDKIDAAAKDDVRRSVSSSEYIKWYAATVVQVEGSRLLVQFHNRPKPKGAQLELADLVLEGPTPELIEVGMQYESLDSPSPAARDGGGSESRGATWIHQTRTRRNCWMRTPPGPSSSRATSEAKKAFKKVFARYANNDIIEGGGLRGLMSCATNEYIPEEFWMGAAEVLFLFPTMECHEGSSEMCVLFGALDEGHIYRTATSLANKNDDFPATDLLNQPNCWFLKHRCWFGSSLLQLDAWLIHDRLSCNIHSVMTKILAISALLVVSICAQTLGQDLLPQKQDVAAPLKVQAGQPANIAAEKVGVAEQAARLATQAAAVATASAGTAATSATSATSANAKAATVAASGGDSDTVASVAAAQLATRAAASQAGVAAAAAAQAARLASRAAQSASAAAAAASAGNATVETAATASASVPASNQAVLSNALQAASIPGSSPVLQWHPWHPLQIWSQLSTLERLLTGISFAGMIKALCMAGNILVQVSPYPQVQRWELRGCTGESDPAPYVSIAFGGWQWCYYGFFAYFVTARSGFLILVHSNILGAILGTYYTITYYRNCKHPDMLQNLQKYLAAVISLVMLQLCTLFMLPVERALFMTGLVSSFCSFVGALSMLFVLPAVLKNQDSRAIPGPLVMANLISAIVWCICGAMLADPMIAAPNFVCCVSSTLCLYLKFLYPSAEDLRPPGSPGPPEDNKGAQASTRRIRPRPWKLGQPVPTDATEATPLASDCDCGTGGTF
eukprot:s142_g11.t1